jgi:hypothetical protein
MSVLFSDTNPKAEAVLVELMRKASFTKKFNLVTSLSAMVINLSKRAIERSNPKLDKKAIDLLFVKYHYGTEIAQKLEKYLDKKSNE